VGEIFRTCPDRPWGPPRLLYNGYQVFPGGKERPGRDPSPLLVPWSRKGSAIPLLSLWAVRPVQSLSACTRVHFVFTLPVTLQVHSLFQSELSTDCGLVIYFLFQFLVSYFSLGLFGSCLRLLRRPFVTYFLPSIFLLMR